MKLIVLGNRPNGTRTVGLPSSLLWAVPLAFLLCLGGAAAAGYHYARASAGVLPGELIVTWRSELQRLGQRTAELRGDAERDDRAYSQRLAALQARLLRMEAVGERLAVAADLDDGEFDFSEEPAVGGPFSDPAAPAAAASELGRQLDELARLISDREHQLELMEGLFLDRNLASEVAVEGRPVVRGYLSSWFGQRIDPFNGRSAWHKGVDFTARQGTPVVAVASGVVTLAGFDKDYGYLVEIRHSDGYSTRYAHNREYVVKAGDVVKKGQLIARVGRTGRASGTHLHFEVLKDGNNVNPMRYIDAQSGG